MPASAPPLGGHELRRIVLLVLGLTVLTTFSVYFVIDGDDSQRAAGALWLVFIGGCALIAAVLAATGTRKPLPPSVGPAPGDPGFRGLVFPTNRAGQLGTALGSLVFASIGAAMIGAVFFAPTDFGEPALGSYTFPALIGGLMCVAFFGPFSLAALAGAARPGALTLTPSRVLYRSGGAGFSAPWADIDLLAVRMVGASPALCVRGTVRGALNLRGHLRALAPLQRGLVGADVAISPRTIRADTAVLRAVLAHLQDHPADRARLDDPAILPVITAIAARVAPGAPRS